MRTLLILSAISLLFATAASAQPFEKMECTKLLSEFNGSMQLLNQLSREIYESREEDASKKASFRFHSKRIGEMQLQFMSYGRCRALNSKLKEYVDYAHLQAGRKIELCNAALERNDEEYYLKNDCN